MTEIPEDRYLHYLLDSPGESNKAEYKAAIEFRENEEFSFKLTKHILGFANNDGGYIIIGFQDGNLSIDPNLSYKITSSYDTTRLSQFVDSCTSNLSKISLVVHKINKHNKVFPIIAVQAFKEYPFFTSDKAEKKNCVNIFKKDALYKRDEAARTVEIVNEPQFRKVIDRCVKLRQGEMLKGFTDLLGMVTGKTLASSKLISPIINEDWIKEARKNALAGFKNESGT